MDAKLRLKIHHLVCHDERDDASDELDRNREFHSRIDERCARERPDSEVGREDARLLEPDHEDLLGGEEAKAHEDDQEESDLRAVAERADAAVGHCRLEVIPDHVHLVEGLVLGVGCREGCCVVGAKGQTDHRTDHPLVRELDVLESGVSERHHGEECHEDGRCLEDPVVGLMLLGVAKPRFHQEDRCECHNAYDAEDHRDLVPLQEGNREAHSDGDGHTVCELAPVVRSNPKDLAELPELHPKSCEDDEVERPGEHKVHPELREWEEEAEGSAAEGDLHGPQRLWWVRRECGEGQHVHGEDARRDEDFLPGVLVHLLERRNERQAHWDERPRGPEVPDDRADDAEEPPEFGARDDLDLEEVEAGDEYCREWDRDELDVVDGERVMQDVHRVLTLCHQEADRPSTQTEEDEYLRTDLLDFERGEDDDRQRDEGEDEVERSWVAVVAIGLDRLHHVRRRRADEDALVGRTDVLDGYVDLSLRLAHILGRRLGGEAPQHDGQAREREAGDDDERAEALLFLCHVFHL